MSVLTLPSKFSKRARSRTVQRALPQAQDQPEDQPKEQPFVLIVENHEDTRLMLKQILAIWGCRAIEAEYGEEAVQIAEQTPPDLILMNVGFPPFDGIEATRRIRQKPPLKTIPIIILSSHAAPAFGETALAAGGDDYLTKPFELSQLESIVAKHLSRSVNKNNIIVGKFLTTDGTSNSAPGFGQDQKGN